MRTRRRKRRRGRGRCEGEGWTEEVKEYLTDRQTEKRGRNGRYKKV